MWLYMSQEYTVLDIPIHPIYPFSSYYNVLLCLLPILIVIHQRHQTNCQMLFPNTIKNEYTGLGYM